MEITHILKTGEVKKDITGHVVKMSDAETVYLLIDRINSEKRSVYEKKNKKQGA